MVDSGGRRRQASYFQRQKRSRRRPIYLQHFESGITCTDVVKSHSVRAMITVKTFEPNRNLPLIVQPEAGKEEEHDLTSLIGWYRDNESVVCRKLLEHGAILFRGFHVCTPSAFARLTRRLCPNLLDGKEENVPRTKLTSGIYTSTEYPAEYRLSMHSEYSYSHHWPKKLFFCCIVAAKEGGGTPIADNRALLRKLAPGVVEEFARKKVKYMRKLHANSGFGLSWQTAFQTTEKSTVEEYCRGTSINFEWTNDGGLRLTQTLPGVINHPETGEAVWFNQAPQFHPSDYPPEIYQSLLAVHKDEGDLPQNVCFGDDTPMNPSMLSHIRETMEREAVTFPWREGDVLLLDNVLVSHGRMPFVGPRKILVAMSES
jgi:alpha-ketoglutarate-dependent taurine dioxygenase